MKAKFAPSLMCMDLMNVQRDVNILDKYCDYYHADIMDGHFVKNLCLSIDFIEKLRKITDKPIDCHLMTTNPENYIDDLIKAKVDCISLHVETINGQAFRLIEKIKKAGIKFGIVLNPETDFNVNMPYLSVVDLITIMSVDPGFAGQKFITESLDKIRLARKYKLEHDLNYELAIDGGCNKNTFKLLSEAGVECFIVGSSGLFSLDSNLEKAYEKMLLDFNKAITCN